MVFDQLKFIHLIPVQYLKKLLPRAQYFFHKNLQQCADKELIISRDLYTELLDDIPISSIIPTEQSSLPFSLNPIPGQQLNEVAWEFEEKVDQFTPNKKESHLTSLNLSFTYLMKTPKRPKKKTVKKTSLTCKAKVTNTNLFNSKDYHKESSKN